MFQSAVEDPPLPLPPLAVASDRSAGTKAHCAVCCNHTPITGTLPIGFPIFVFSTAGQTFGLTVGFRGHQALSVVLPSWTPSSDYLLHWGMAEGKVLSPATPPCRYLPKSISSRWTPPTTTPRLLSRSHLQKLLHTPLPPCSSLQVLEPAYTRTLLPPRAEGKMHERATPLFQASADELICCVKYSYMH